MPAYPVNFRKSGIQGVVVLDVEVLEDGTVGDIIVIKSLLSEEGAMDDAAVLAVKSWIFKPALLNNKPVKSRVNIPISFSLKGQ
jgi:protein TonB